MLKHPLALFLEYAHRRAIAYPVFLGGALALAGYLLIIESKNYLVAGLTAVAFAGAVALHWGFTRLPRVRANAIGVAFAIQCDDPAERALLRTDFIGEIRRSLLKS